MNNNLTSKFSKLKINQEFKHMFPAANKLITKFSPEHIQKYLKFVNNSPYKSCVENMTNGKFSNVFFM